MSGPRHKTKNLFNIIDNARISGRCPRSWWTTKCFLSTAEQTTLSDAFAKMPPLLCELVDACVERNARRTRKILTKLTNFLFGGHSAAHGVSSLPLMSFLAWGGLDLVLKLIFLDDHWIMSGQQPMAFQIWNLCIKIATEFVMVDPTLSWYMFSREKRIVRRALKLLGFKSTFENAAVMCEQLLAAIGPCVELASVCSDFSSLISKMNDMQLALVCRVLALLVNPAWNVQVHDNSHKFARLITRLKRVESLMQRNHDLVIDHPQILTRLVNLLKYQVTQLRSMQFGGSFALLLPVSFLDSSVNHGISTPPLDSFVEEHITSRSEGAPQSSLAMLFGAVHGHSQQTENSSDSQYQQASLPPVMSVQTEGGDNLGMDLTPAATSQSMTWFFNPSPQHCDSLVEESLVFEMSHGDDEAVFEKNGLQYKADTRFSSTLDDVLYGGVFGEEARSLSIVSCQSEVLFILSSLLSGKRSAEVWHRLSAKNILQVIYDTFDSIFTDKEVRVTVNEGNENSTHANSSHDSTGPQNHRHDPETLRKMEYLRLVHEYWDCRDVYELHNNARPAHKTCKRQLAQKLVDRLLKQSEDPCTYNVLTYALEAFIRGTPFALRQAEQRFLSTQVIPHLVDVIAECKNEHRIESEFSLLAELTKFNHCTMYQLENVLAGNEALYNGLVTVVCARPFHSNLFLRALLLTLASYPPNTSLLLIPQLRCCPKCKLKSESQSDYWEPYSVFVERIQKAKEVVMRVRANTKDATLEVEALLAALRPPFMDNTTCTICFESVLGSESINDGADSDPADEQYVPNEALRQPPTLLRLVTCNKVRMIRNLMVEISLQQVCRENMCCVTTTLVFFVIACHSSGLPALLQQIRDYELAAAEEWCAQSSDSIADVYAPKGEAGGERMDPFRNFFDLVCIWLAYYADRHHYQDTLFYCTHIPMGAWRATVKSLIELLPQYYLC